jgi:hypothetical protein
MGGKFSPRGLRGGYPIGWRGGDGGQIRPVEPPWIPGTPHVSQTEHLIYKEKTLAPPVHSFPLTRSLTAAFYFPQIASGASATKPWPRSLPTSPASGAPTAPSRRPSLLHGSSSPHPRDHRRCTARTAGTWPPAPLCPSMLRLGHTRPRATPPARDKGARRGGRKRTRQA